MKTNSFKHLIKIGIEYNIITYSSRQIKHELLAKTNNKQYVHG